MFEVGFLSDTSKVDLQQIGAGLQTRMELVIEDPVMGKVSGFEFCILQHLSLTASVKLIPIAFVVFRVVVFDGFFIF